MATQGQPQRSGVGSHCRFGSGCLWMVLVLMLMLMLVLVLVLVLICEV